MSDDTPTQRLPEGGDAPTERMPEAAPPTAPSASAPAADGELAQERTKSRTLLFVLIGVGALLLAAIIVLLVILLGGRGTPAAAPTNSTSSSASPPATPTPTPTPTPSETEDEEQPPSPPPAPEVSAIIGYNVDKTDAGCTSDADSPSITFNWNTTGSSVTFAIGNPSAELGPFESGLPAVGGITVNYQCSEDGPDQIYAIAVIGPNGDVIGRQSITVSD